MNGATVDQHPEETGANTKANPQGYLVRDQNNGILGAGRTNTGAMTDASQACVKRGAEPGTWIVQKVAIDQAAQALGFLMLGDYPRVLQRLAHARTDEGANDMRHAFCIAGAWVPAGFATDRRTLVGMALPDDANPEPAPVMPECPDCHSKEGLTPTPAYTETGGTVRCAKCNSRFGYPSEGSKTDLSVMDEPTGPDRAWVLEYDGTPKGIGATVDDAIRDAEQRFGEGLFAARRKNTPQMLSVNVKTGKDIQEAWDGLHNIVLSDAGATIAEHFGTRRPPVGVPIEIQDIEKFTQAIAALNGCSMGHRRWQFEDESFLHIIGRQGSTKKYVVLG